MKNALRDAKINPDQIDYINAHGTSTPLGDQAETNAIRRVFESHADRLAISSTKSQLGHLLGASGGVEFVICALALQHQVAPPTINLETPDPGCALDYIPNEARPTLVGVYMNISFTNLDINHPGIAGET